MYHGPYCKPPDDNSFKVGLKNVPASLVPHVVTNLSAIQDQINWFNPWVGKIPWGSKWQPIPVFFPGEFYGQRSLVGYSPKSRTKSML